MAVSAGGTSLVITITGSFNSTTFNSGSFTVITPESGVGNSTPSNTKFSDGTPVTPITLIPLPFASLPNPFNVLTLTLPRAFPVGAITTQGILGMGNVGVSATATTNFTSTASQFPVIPVGTLINVTPEGGSGFALNYNRLTNVPVITSTAASLVLGGSVIDTGTLGFGSGITRMSFASPGLGTYSGSVLYAGSGYKNDSFLLRGTLFGGTSPANDVVLTTVPGTSSLGIPTAVTSLVASGTPVSGTPVTAGPFILSTNTLRDSSDYTQNIREVDIYNESRSGTNIVGSLKDTRLSRLGITKLNDYGGANQLELRQGNGFRMAYLKGRMNCAPCYGGFFNVNGPLSSS